jgi:thiol:disulfide interchange protein DsbD
LLTLVLYATALGAGEPRADVSAALDTSALHPQQQAVLAIVLDIRPGFHSQSHHPTKKNYIATEITLEPNSAVTFFDPMYPAGRAVNFPALGKLDIYEGRTVFYVPLLVKAGTSGTVSITGTIRYQICDDRTCFVPVKTPFDVTAEIVPASQEVQANRPELFAGFDPRTFAKVLSTTGPASLPSAAAIPAVPSATDIDLFGMHFSLGAHNYLLAFAVAFAAGVLFNFVPCVLPVVPLKIIGFYEASGHHRRRSVALGASFSAGLVAAFGALALFVLIASRGWGQLFGYLWFKWTIAGILVLMALGMFGVFTMNLPTGVYAIAPRHDTYWGNFLFGILTAVLATPCVGPMFPGLLAWAASQPRSLGLGAVMMVGVGMGAPYLLLSAFPEVARKLPRSGPWAQTVKQMMGFLLLSLAVYFAGPLLLPGRSFWYAILAIVAASGVFLVGRTLIHSRRPMALTVSVCISLMLVGGTWWMVRALTFTPPAGAEGIAWRAYSPEAFAEARKSGKVVVLEFTADWCASCQWVEANVFHDPRTIDAFARLGVIPFRADLSSEDAPGWKPLAALTPTGGIPLTAIYSPDRDHPITIATAYTTPRLLAALEQAHKSTGLVEAAGVVPQAAESLVPTN